MNSEDLPIHVGQGSGLSTVLTVPGRDPNEMMIAEVGHHARESSEFMAASAHWIAISEVVNVTLVEVRQSVDYASAFIPYPCKHISPHLDRYSDPSEARSLAKISVGTDGASGFDSSR
jgi:hypothetical protein